MGLAGMAAGGLFIAFVGMLRDRRGVNETISSLLLTYIAIGVFNFSSRVPMQRSGQPEQAVHLSDSGSGDAGQSCSVRTSIGDWLRDHVLRGVPTSLMYHTDVRFCGADGRRQRGAAQGRACRSGFILVTCAPGRRGRGLAGMVEIAAVHGQANASLSPATGSPASWCRSSPGTIRWPSFRRRSCSAA